MQFVLLFLIALIWGSQFILNDNALLVISPFELAFYRCLFGWMALSLLIKLFSNDTTKIVWNKDLIVLLILLTLFESVIPLVLNGYGQQEVSSSVTAVLMATIPLMTLILEFFVNKRSMKLIELLGILVGIIGIVLLVYPDLKQSETLHFSYILFILTGAFCFAMALIIITKIPKDIPSLRFTRAVLLASSITLLPMAFVDSTIANISNFLWIKLIVLGSFASGIVYFLYLNLVRKSGAVFTSLTNFIVPAVGVGIGVFFNNDSFVWMQFGGFAIILIGLVLVNLPRLKERV